MRLNSYASPLNHTHVPANTRKDRPVHLFYLCTGPGHPNFAQTEQTTSGRQSARASNVIQTIANLQHGVELSVQGSSVGAKRG